VFQQGKHWALRLSGEKLRFDLSITNGEDFISTMDGILIVDKTQGPTSHDVVAQVRRILKEKRVGHTGTLDPFATGVLVLMLGKATRLARFLSTDEKEYEATIRFGYSTDTGDLTGTPNSPVNDLEAQTRPLSAISILQLESVMDQLRGEIEQIPPMYSAKKIAGKKLYELARRGEEVERKAVQVTISQFETVGMSQFAGSGQPVVPFSRNSDGTLDLAVRVICSAGTYVRTLAEDLGRLLGTRAHLVALRRNRAGTFRIENSISLDKLRIASETGGNFSELILSPQSALSFMPFLHLSVVDAQKVRHGGFVPAALLSDGSFRDCEAVRLHDESDELIAIGYFDKATNTIAPRIVLCAEN
jgi:tRNA pseudouridine55 synthase